MAFDTKSALEAGYSQEEINAYITNKNKPVEELEESSNVEFDTKGALESGYSQEEINTYLANKNKPQEEEEYDTSIARKYIADPTLSVLKGITQLPDVVSGIADMAVSPLTGGKLSVGKGFEYLEEQLPDALQDLGETLEQAKSPEIRAKREAQRKEIDAAKGFKDTALTTIGTMLENPSLLFDTLFESLPSTFSGGVIGKGLLRANKLRKAGLGTVGAGAIGEGLVSGGSTAEGIRQETEDGVLSAKQAGIAGLSGILTSIFGKAGGSLSQKFNAFDIDTYLAGGREARKAQSKIFAAFKSMVIEGTVEELPQSMQEQMAQNIALGKDPMEGVAEAGATGFLLGMAMGGGASVLLDSSSIDTDTSKVNPPPENKKDYVEDESLNTDPVVFGESNEEKINIEDTIVDPQEDMFSDTKIEGVDLKEKEFKKIEKNVYSTREKAEEKLNALFNKGRYKDIATKIFEVKETTIKDKKTKENIPVFKVVRIDFKDMGGGGTGDEGTLTLEQEKTRYERLTTSPEDVGAGIERVNSKGNRVGNVVFGELDSADTDTETVKKSKRNAVDRAADASGGPDATKVDSSSTLEFINKTDSKSPLRKPAITKVLINNPKILETATTDETTETTETSQIAEGLKPVQQERKVLDVAIREVVAEEYAASSKTKRNKMLKKYKDPAEKKLEKEYQKVAKKNNIDIKNAAAVARAANNKKLGDRKVSAKGVVTYFTGAKPQEFIKDKTIIEEINRKSFGLNKYKNFKTALKNEGLLDQYNKEVDNIIASPPGTQNVANQLATEPGQAVPEKYAFETAEARDKFIETTTQNVGKENEARDEVKDRKGNLSKDFEITPQQELVSQDLPGDIQYKYTARVITKPSITEQERQQKERSAGEENAPEPSSYRSDSAITNGEDLAQQELDTKIGNIQKVLEETIGKKGATLQEVLDVLSNYQGQQATLNSTKLADVFSNLLKKMNQNKETAAIFKDIKIVINNNLKDKGEYNPNANNGKGLISINLELLNQNQVQDVGPVVIHEIVHAMLDRVLLAKNFNKLSTSMQVAVTNIKNQYNKFKILKKKQPNSIFNRAKSLKEFVAMMFESSELANAMAEAAAQQKIKIETTLFEQGLQKQDMAEDEFTNYIYSITGTRPIQSRIANVSKVIVGFFKDVMSALGLGSVGANIGVQDVVQNSIKILLDKDYGKTYKKLTPGGISNFGDQDTKNANEKFENEGKEEIENAPKEKSFYKNKTLSEIFGDAVEKIQDVHGKVKSFTQKLSDGNLLTVDNDINTRQTLINGVASNEHKQFILPFMNNMYLAYENFKSIMGMKNLKVLENRINNVYEALGEYSRARWLFLINMPLPAATNDKFTIPKWKDETGKIGPWTGTPYELREAILRRMSAAKETEATNQSATNEIKKLREALERLIDSNQQKALAIFKTGADKVLWQLPNPDRKSKDSISTATRATFDPMDILYSSGTLGVNNKDNTKNISSQLAAQKLLKTIGINYDANLTPMTEQQLKENKKVVLDKPKRDSFMQLAKRIDEANDGIKEVNKRNGYVPPQASNIIDFMDFKYYKSLKRKNDKDKSLHKVRDERFMEGERASGDLNSGIEEKFTGGQQSQVNNVIAQTEASGILAAMRYGMQGYTQAIATLSKDTVEITTKEGKTIQQPLANFLKFNRTVTFQNRHELSENEDLEKDIRDKKVILNFKNNGDIDIINITKEDMIIPLKGHIAELHTAFRMLAIATSIIGQVHTRFSIPFALTNFQRDFFTNIPLLIIKNPSAAMPYIANILGQAFKGNFATTWRYVRAMNRNDIAYVKRGLKKPNSYKKSQAEYEKTYDYAIASYLVEGGMMSYVRGVSAASESELLTKEIRKSTSMLNTAVVTRVFDAWINTFEIAVRASAAKALRPVLFKKALKQAGNPKPDSAEYKNIKEKIEGTAAATVKNFANFEQAGTKSAFISSLYMFFKPSMTSAVVNVKAIAPAFTSEQTYLNTHDPQLLQSPEYKKNAIETFKGERIRAQAVVIGGGGLGYALWTILASLGDEEDQKKYKQDNMERWVRNIRIPLSSIPEGAKDLLGIKKDGSGDTMIQMHWGFGNMGWPAIGVQLASFVDGKMSGPNNPRVPTDFEFNDLFSNLTNIAMDNFLPIPISRSKLTDDPVFYFLDSVIPSVAKPLFEYVSNKDTFGYQVTRQRTSTVGGAYGGTMTTDQLYVNLAQFINENTRFNTEGAVQIDPNILKFIANSYLDGFARIVSVLSESGKITDLESAKNRTLLFKQFFTRQVPVERDRYATMTKKLKNIKMTNKQYEDLDITGVDSKGRNYEDFVVQNATNLEMVDLYDQTEKKLKKIYKEQKEYQLTVTNEMRELDNFEVQSTIEDFKIEIITEMRELTNTLEQMDEDNFSPLFK